MGAFLAPRWMPSRGMRSGSKLSTDVSPPVSRAPSPTRTLPRGWRCTRRAHAHTHTRARAHTHKHMHTYTHAHTLTLTYTQTHTHTHIHARTQTYTQTHTHTHTQTYAHTLVLLHMLLHVLLHVLLHHRPAPEVFPTRCMIGVCGPVRLANHCQLIFFSSRDPPGFPAYLLFIIIFLLFFLIFFSSRDSPGFPALPLRTPTSPLKSLQRHTGGVRRREARG